jgi:hypothetical protein
MPKPAWKTYQEEAAALFCSLGMDASTSEVLEGARGKHEIDVAVRTRRAGIAQLWVVECKYWKRRVGKDRVLVLAEVAADLGADRGLLLSESGFQAGAVRVARSSNVTLSSISDLRENAAEEKAELDAKIALKRISLMLERVRLLRNPVGYARWESRMLPGVDTSVTIPIVGRLSLAQKGLENALAGILPTLVDARPGGTSVVLDTLRAVADAAEAVLMWAEQEIITQEEIAVTEVPGP